MSPDRRRPSSQVQARLAHATGAPASAASATGTPSVGVPSFARIAQPRAHEYVAEQLRRQIGLRLLPVDRSLPSDRQLAGMFGVGRATVQAAIRLLEADGLVYTRRGRHGGTFVTGHGYVGGTPDGSVARLRHDQARILEALAFRDAVEQLAARLAAHAGTPSDIDQLRAAHVQGAGAATDTDFMASDSAFHLAVARAAHNTFVRQAVEQTRLALGDAIVALPETDVWHRRTTADHAGILEAIVAHDDVEAAKRMKRHIRSTEQSVRALLSALGAEGGSSEELDIALRPRV